MIQWIHFIQIRKFHLRRLLYKTEGNITCFCADWLEQYLKFISLWNLLVLIFITSISNRNGCYVNNNKNRQEMENRKERIWKLCMLQIGVQFSRFVFIFILLPAWGGPINSERSIYPYITLPDMWRIWLALIPALLNRRPYRSDAYRRAVPSTAAQRNKKTPHPLAQY